MRTYLTRIDRDACMARFYAVMVTRTLFGEWAVVRKWGRIGQGGTVRSAAFDSMIEAEYAAATLVHRKQRKGYIEIGGEA